MHAIGIHWGTTSSSVAVVKNDKVRIIQNNRGEKKTPSSERILVEMKKIAEDYLHVKVTDAVITIPAYFDSSQRQATKDAGIMAGLNVLEIISEPTAVALAYRHCNTIVEERNVLVYDIGYETFNASVVKIRDDEIEVRSTTGDRNLGGRDFDNRMMKDFISEFQRKHNKDISSSERAVSRLRHHCEKAKCCLSASLEARVSIPDFVKGIDFHATITRSRFGFLIGDLVQTTLSHVDKCLHDAGIGRCDIDDIVLVGGSTRIPEIRSALQDIFYKIELKESLNSDEVVAYGTAVEASNFEFKVTERQRLANLFDSECTVV